MPYRWNKLPQTASFIWGMRHFLQGRLSPAEAESLIRCRLQNRENNFLQMLENKVFGHARSPYLPLLRQAGCSLGDIRSMVTRLGLETALHTLQEAGVYFTFEEFKGRLPVRRGNLEFTIQSGDFDNPRPGPAYTSSTSGSTGRSVQVTLPLKHVAANTPYLLLYEQTLQVRDLPQVLWFAGFPGFLGPKVMLKAALCGTNVARWFVPFDPSEYTRGVKMSLMRTAFCRLLRHYGHFAPEPEPVPLNRADHVAKTVYSLAQSDGGCVVRSFPGMCLRVCLAAKELGLSLENVHFISGGEPLTAAKTATIAGTGATLHPLYSMSETDNIGMGCLNPVDQTDVHLFTDSVAVIPSKRPVGGEDMKVDALCFTSLLPSNPKILLNVQSDDYATMEHRSCGCPWESLGLTTHLRDINSFGKLTGEGVTLVGNDAIRILEETLPTKFGGSPQDYQLAEEEDGHGRTIITLRMSPHIPLQSDDDVITVFLAAVKEQAGNPFAARQWEKAGVVRLRREPPVWSPQGKLLPLYRGRVSGDRI